jgi:hypothetical protein
MILIWDLILVIQLMQVLLPIVVNKHRGTHKRDKKSSHRSLLIIQKKMLVSIKSINYCV